MTACDPLVGMVVVFALVPLVLALTLLALAVSIHITSRR